MNPPLVDMLGLSVGYRGQSAPALSGIDLVLGPGSRLAVIGESGSGKSTLALAIAGLLPRDATVTGRIGWDTLRPPAPGRDYGFVFQDPSASLDPLMTVGAQIEEVVRTHLGPDRRAARARALELAAQVRLPNPAAILAAYPHQLSGGQKQRGALACALAAGPRLLICDEATSALDTIVQAEIVALIDTLVAESGMALLFVTHDIALASQLADTIAVLRAGRLVEFGVARQVVTRPAEAYTRALLGAHIALDAPRLVGP